MYTTGGVNHVSCTCPGLDSRGHAWEQTYQDSGTDFLAQHILDAVGLQLPTRMAPGCPGGGRLSWGNRADQSSGYLSLTSKAVPQSDTSRHPQLEHGL